MKTDALVIYLKKTLGITVRASGYMALVKDNCAACSGFPDNIEPAQKDIGEVIDRIDKLIETLSRGGK